MFRRYGVYFILSLGMHGLLVFAAWFFFQAETIGLGGKANNSQSLILYFKLGGGTPASPNAAPTALAQASPTEVQTAHSVKPLVPPATRVEPQAAPAPQRKPDKLNALGQKQKTPDAQSTTTSPAPKAQLNLQDFSAPPLQEAHVAGQQGGKGGGEGDGTDEASAGDGAKENQRVLALIRRRIEAAKRYPLLARRQGLSGRCRVSFIIEENGQVSSLKLTRSSGSALLDQAALDTIKAAQPLPHYPEAIELTLHFELEE